MTRLAEETGAFCKLSGLVTEAQDDWSAEALRPFSDHVLVAFGPKRVMWGSDWPVARLRCDYADWHALAHDLTGWLGRSAQDEIFAGTARRFYRLPPA